MNNKFYLCGCDPEQKKNYATFTTIVAGQEVPSNRRIDEEGYEICPEHGERLYGWNSPQVIGPMEGGSHRQHDFSQYHNRKPLDVDWVKVRNNPDRRDTRDPEQVGVELLVHRAEKRARSNGHVN